MATTASLNPVDATLWAIRRDPELRTTIVALALLDQAPEWDRLRGAIERAADRIPRLRQRVVEPTLGLGRPHWEETELDLDHHVRRMATAEPGLRSVLDLCGTLAGEDFDEARPLWEVVLVEGWDETQAALVLKISHSLTDGVGGVGLLRLLDDDHVPEEPDPPAPPPSDHGHLWSVPTGLVSAAVHAGLHPVATVEEAGTVLGSAGRVLRPTGEPLSPLMTARSLQRWTDVAEVSLERLRAAAHRADGSINDAFVTIALGAVWDYHDAMGVPGSSFRVTMPVSFRRDDDDDGGNQWTPARLVLDVDGHAHPFAQLAAHQRRLRAAVGEPANSFTQTISAGMQQLPAGLTAGIVAGMVKGSDVVLTDVPGLGEGLTIAGARVERLYPFAPTGGAAVNIGLLSHQGTACLGFTLDRAAVDRPELLVRCFEERTDDFLRQRRPRPAAMATADDPEPTAEAESEPSHTPHERLSALDTSFLRMESPTTPMHMGVLCILDGAPLRSPDGSLDLVRLRTHIADRARHAPRLTKRVEEVPFELGRPVWVDDDTDALASHVWASTLPAPGGRAELLERCEELQMQCLDRTRPLFDMHFIDGLDPDEFGPDAVALVQRVHHALLDGMSGVELLAVLFDAEPDPHRSPTEAAPPVRAERTGPVQLVAEALGDLLAEPGAYVRMGIDALRSPLRSTRRLLSALAALGDVLGTGATPSLNRPVGHHRRLLSLTVPLDRVHDTGVELGGTVNDVVLSAVTRGLRALFAERDELVDGPLRALVPVSTRHTGMDGEHGNHVSALVVELPVRTEDPIGTFVAVSTRTRDLKNHHHADGTEVMMDASDHLPPVALDLVSRMMGQQHAVNLVVTNLPGPPLPLYLLGGEIRELIPIVPLGANLTVGVAVLSYCGELTLAFHADRDACADLEVLVDGTRQGFDDLAALAGL